MKAIKKPQAFLYTVSGNTYTTTGFDGQVKTWNANQFENRFEVDANYDGVARDKKVAVDAIQIPVAFSVQDGGATLTGNANDWLVIRDSGDIKVLSDANFRQKYMLLG